MVKHALLLISFSLVFVGCSEEEKKPAVVSEYTKGDWRAVRHCHDVIKDHVKELGYKVVHLPAVKNAGQEKNWEYSYSWGIGKIQVRNTEGKLTDWSAWCLANGRSEVQHVSVLGKTIYELKN